MNKIAILELWIFLVGALDKDRAAAFYFTSTYGKSVNQWLNLHTYILLYD